MVAVVVVLVYLFWEAFLVQFIILAGQLIVLITKIDNYIGFIKFLTILVYFPSWEKY